MENNEFLEIKSNIKAGAFEPIDIMNDIGNGAKGVLGNLIESAESLYSYRTDYLPRITLGP